MIKEFFLKRMLGSQLSKAGVSDEQQDQIMQMVMKNPELFKKIAKEVQDKLAGMPARPNGHSGGDQMKAIQEVMAAHQSELEGLQP
jgi:hypothetical protein